MNLINVYQRKEDVFAMLQFKAYLERKFSILNEILKPTSR